MPNYVVFYLRRYLSYRQVVVLLETFQAFSTVGPLTKDCQSNVADGLGVYKTCIELLLRRVVLFVLSSIMNPDFVQACVLEV